MTEDRIVDRCRTYLMAQARHQLYADPLVLARGEMDCLYDRDGNEYIDLFSGIMVVNFGHCNPEINEAVHRQLDTLGHVSTFYLTEGLADLAETIARITPEGLQRSFFVNSGSEAVDGALVLARAYTGNRRIIPVRHAYHGRTLLGTACTNVSPSGAIHPEAGPLQVDVAANGYCYRCPHGLSHPGCGLACTRDVCRLIEENGEPTIAAVLLEPIQGVGGVICPPHDYLRRMQEIAHHYGGLLVADEVQSGFGRTGEVFYSNGVEGFFPDILCMAKAMGNGFPVGAMIARDEVGEALETPTFATFGGSPLAAAAARASIGYMERHGIPARVRAKGKLFLEGLRALARTHGIIGDIRGAGLFLGMEIVESRDTREPAGEKTLALLEECRKRGVLVGKSGPQTNVVRIGPPLVITEEHIARSLEVLDEALSAVQQSG